MLDVTPYSIAIFVHVLSAVALTGHALAAPLQQRLIREAATTTDLLRWMELARLEARFNPAIALVLLASGVYLGSFGWWGMPWFYVALGVWIVSSVLARAVLQPTGVAIATAAAHAGPGPVPPALDALRRSRAWTMASAAMLGMDLALLWVMFNKPSLVASLAVTVLAVAICSAARVTTGRKAADAAQPAQAAF